jgi:hypothetical protein
MLMKTFLTIIVQSDNCIFCLNSLKELLKIVSYGSCVFKSSNKLNYFHSAYLKSHSTATCTYTSFCSWSYFRSHLSLQRITNYFCLLDLSAAFDTTDIILFSFVVSPRFGFLFLLILYLKTDKTQF